MREMHFVFQATVNQPIAKGTAFFNLLQPCEKCTSFFKSLQIRPLQKGPHFSTSYSHVRNPPHFPNHCKPSHYRYQCIFSISKSPEKRPASPPTLQDDPVPPVPAVPLTFPVPLTLPAGEPYSPFPVHLRTTFAGELQSESDIGSFSPV